MKNTEYKKRVNIVSIKMVKEKSLLFEHRKIGNPTHIYELVKDFLADADREIFMVICLNTKNEPININTVGVGTINCSMIKVADILKTAILSNSYKIILAHNHPSGDPSPSNEDKQITEKIKTASELFGIKVLDHVIVADNKYYSFLEKKFLFDKSE